MIKGKGRIFGRNMKDFLNFTQKTRFGIIELNFHDKIFSIITIISSNEFQNFSAIQPLEEEFLLGLCNVNECHFRVLENTPMGSGNNGKT